MARTKVTTAERKVDETDVTLPIRPQVGMYGAFSRLNYKAWYAIAEFVDNAIQSFLSNKSKLAKADGNNGRLLISIEVAQDRVTVSDNAAGIARNDLGRAFTPAEPPPNASGLSEFGLGMKAAACWFAQRWIVRTKALGEKVERTISFDVQKIVENGIEELRPASRPVTNTSSHYTSIVLEQLNVRPQTRTIKKMKEHLASMYRAFLRDGDVEIRFNGESLAFEEPEILHAPPFKTPSKAPIEWRKNITVKLDNQHRITGWAGLREKGSVSEAGFAVFRRNRLIQGSYDETYRPEQIFGKPNSFTYQRLTGELHVEGFRVSHTKDGLQWDEWEDLIIDELSKELNASPIALLDQAEGHRQGRSKSSSGTWGRNAAKDAAAAIEQHAPPVLADQLESRPETKKPAAQLPPAKLTASEAVDIEIKHGSLSWMVKVEIANEPQNEDWFSYSRHEGDKKGDELTIRINLGHPFSEKFGLSREQDLEPLVRIAAAFALAEITALKAGVPASCRTVRRNFNQLLRSALSH
jgi:hypothetical protein